MISNAGETMRHPTLILLIGLCAVAPACSSSSKAERSSATTSPTTVAVSTTTTPQGGTAYATKGFVVPLTVTVDRELKAPPSTASSNLLSWDATASSDNKVRF